MVDRVRYFPGSNPTHAYQVTPSNDDDLPVPTEGIYMKVSFDEAGNAVPVVGGSTATILSSSSYALEIAQTGGFFVLNRGAGGVSVALHDTEAADAGSWFDFYIAAPISSGNYLFTDTNWTSLFSGRVTHYDTDTSNALNVYAANGSTHNAVLLSATTGAGAAGGWFRLTVLGENSWAITGTLFGTGSPATPFAVLE